MSRNILGQGQTGTILIGGQLNINTLGATKIQGDRITNNSIDFYTADVEATSQDDWNINLNNGGLGSASKFVIKNNDTTKMTMDDSGLNLASGMVYKINNSQISSSNLTDGDNLVKTSGNITIGGVKTFSNNIVGNLTGALIGNSTTATTATSAVKLQTARAIAGEDFDGTAPITLSSSNLSNTTDIVLKDATQTITNKSIDATQLTGTINNSRFSLSSSDLTNTTDIVLKDATQTLTNKSIVATQLTGTINNSRLNLSSANLTNTSNILLTNSPQDITSQKNYTTGKITLATGQPTTLPGLINCNGKIYIHGTSNKGLTIARHTLYDQVGSGNGTTRREWNIVCPSDNNKLRFNFLQQSNGGTTTNEDVVQFSSNGIETALITTTKIQQESGDLTIETADDLIFNIDDNGGLANKFSFQDDGEEMVRIFRSSSNGVEHAMSKSYLVAEGYIRAENSIIRNSNGIINLGVMLGVSSNTNSGEAGELRFNRHDPDGTENIRFHSIKTSCSSLASQNLMEFYLHDPNVVSPTNQGQKKVLTLQGNGNALFQETLSCLGPINIDTGGIFGTSNGFRYAGISTNVNNLFAFTIGGNRIRCRVDNSAEINISGSISDIRLKSDIIDCEDTTDIVNKIQVKKYTFGDTEFSKNNSFGFEKIENEVGIIADELMEIIPQAVNNTEEDEIKTIEYDIIIPYLIKNLQQNNKIITELNKKVEDLEETILGLME